MKTKVLYVLFFLYMLMVFSCRRQDDDNPWQNYSWTDPFAYTRETDEDIPEPVDSSWVEDVSVYGYVIPEMKDELDTCISPALRKCITSYIDKFDYKGSFEYYCLYFFRRGADNYFTIWQLVYTPKKWFEYDFPGITFQYYWFTMHKKEIVLIFAPDDKQILPFSACINQLGDWDAKFLPDAPDMIQERYHYRTYKYIQKDNGFYIEPLRDTIYMGNNQNLGYEIRLLKRENGLPED